VTTTYTIDFGPDMPARSTCACRTDARAIRDTLFSSVQGEQMELDRRWLRLLPAGAGRRVQLVANLCEVPLTLEQVMSLTAAT
jgi:flagellar motor switch protein FliM